MRSSIALMLCLLIFTCAVQTACTKSKEADNSTPRVVETAPTPSQAMPSSSTANTANTSQTQPADAEALELPPPKPEEVRDAVARVYKDAVTIEMRAPTSYVVGDFNGDGSQDIAVVVRPAKEKLEEINSEVANWIIEDPQQVMLPDPHKSVQKLPPATGPVKVRPDDLLLTIIHGYQKEGWRNPAAQQTYLLNNAVGSSMMAEPLKDLQSATGNKNVRATNAHVIKEKLAGAQGFLYWTGAKYAWHRTP